MTSEVASLFLDYLTVQCSNFNNRNRSGTVKFLTVKDKQTSQTRSLRAKSATFETRILLLDSVLITHKESMGSSGGFHMPSAPQFSPGMYS